MSDRSSTSVDLGSAEEVADRTALVIRDELGRTHQQGLPTAGEPAADVAAPASRLRRIRTSFTAYGALRRTPYGLTPAVVFGSVMFFMQFKSQAYLVSGPFIVRDLEVPITDITGLLAIVGVITAFVAIGVGWLLDRTRRIPYMGVGVMLSGVFGMVSSRAGSLFAYGAPRVAASVAIEGGNVPLFSLLADYYPPESRGRVFALLSTLRRVGSVSAIFAVGLLISWVGWRTTIAVVGVPVVLTGLVILLRLREPIRGYMERKAIGASDEEARLEDEPKSFGEAWRSIFSIRTLRRLFIGDAFSLAGDGIYLLFLPFFLVDRYDLSAWDLSLFSLPALVAGILGGLYGGTVMDRFIQSNPAGVLRIVGLFSAVSSLGVLGFAAEPPIALLLAFSAVNAFFAALIGPASSAVYAQVLPASIRTQGLQITGLAAVPGFIIFTPVANTIFNEYGYNATFLWAVPLLVVGGIVAATAGSFFDLDARSAFAAAMADQEWKKAKAAGNTKLLVCRDVDVAYDGVQVLFNVDFDVEEGEIIALLGTNGAGKSTLLRAISGTQAASGGAVVFDGRDITHMPPHEIAGRGVVHMPGGRGVFPGLTVQENLALANWLVDDPTEIQERMREVLEIFPVLRDRLHTPAGTLSGGEQQQVSLAQAFLANPRLLLIDELSLGLSPAVVAQLLDIVREIHRRGVTVIVVEQSVNVALELADKAVFMEKGEVKFYGETKDLLARPDILRAVYVKGSTAIASTPGSAQRTERERRMLELGDSHAVLEIEHLTKRYGGITAVNDVSFTLREGEVLGLIGPNGAGKTTIFDLISGFQSVDAGRVLFDGVDITAMPPDQRARSGMVRRFQDARLFPALTVFETLLVALEQQLEVKSSLLSAVAAPQARRAERRLRAKAERLIDVLELGAFRDKFVKELSTGVRRILDLACVLATEPKVLLLDEPSSGVAQAEAEGFAPLLRRIRYETGCSILIIEHDMPLISAVSDELIALDRGTFVLRGAPDVVLNDERVVESYLGTTEAAVNRSGRSTIA